MSKFRLMLELDISLNGESVEDQVARLYQMMQLAAGEGLITGDGPAEVESYWVEVQSMPDNEDIEPEN